MYVGTAHPVAGMPAQCVPAVDTAPPLQVTTDAGSHLLGVDDILAEHHLERRIALELEARAPNVRILYMPPHTRSDLW